MICSSRAPAHTQGSEVISTYHVITAVEMYMSLKESQRKLGAIPSSLHEGLPCFWDLSGYRNGLGCFAILQANVHRMLGPLLSKSNRVEVCLKRQRRRCCFKLLYDIRARLAYEPCSQISPWTGHIGGNIILAALSSVLAAAPALNTDHSRCRWLVDTFTGQARFPLLPASVSDFARLSQQSCY